MDQIQIFLRQLSILISQVGDLFVLIGVKWRIWLGCFNFKNLCLFKFTEDFGSVKSSYYRHYRRACWVKAGRSWYSFRNLKFFDCLRTRPDFSVLAETKTEVKTTRNLTRSTLSKALNLQWVVLDLVYLAPKLSFAIFKSPGEQPALWIN